MKQFYLYYFLFALLPSKAVQSCVIESVIKHLRRILAQTDPCSPGCFPCEKITNASSCVNSDSEILRVFSHPEVCLFIFY